MVSDRVFDRSMEKLDGVYHFYFTPKTALIPSHTDNGSSEGGRIIEIPQEGNRKPHYAIVDGDGDTVIETTGLHSNIRTVIQPLVGNNVEFIIWKPSQTDGIGRATDYEATLGLTHEKRETTGEPIPAIYIDTETTGLYPGQDEILQLSIVNQDGNTLWDRLYKPEHVESWPDAARINHIYKKTVADKPPISGDMAQIQEIFDRAREVYVWNAKFDLAFLAEEGLRLDTAKVHDTMREYGQKHHGTPYYKLTRAASECGYHYTAHDSLQDAAALLAVQNRLDGDGFVSPPGWTYTPSPTGNRQQEKKKHGAAFWITLGIILAALLALVIWISVSGNWPTVIIILIIAAIIITKL